MAGRHGGPASTVVDCTGERATVLRVGAIPVSRLARVLDAAGITNDPFDVRPD